jgi:protein-tyrosine phosphatase
MIDLHIHVLPGIDDGPATLEECVDLAAAAVADGVTALAATPHVSDRYPTSPAEMERSVEILRRALAEAELELDVLPGGEIALSRLRQLSLTELRRFGLGGNPACLLVEFPYYGWPLDLAQTLVQLQDEDFRVVMAHPERNPEVQAAPQRLEPLVASGVLLQLTATSMDGRHGREPRETARRLLDSGLAHLLASDAHSVGSSGLAGASQRIGDERLARWLTEDVPAAVVAGAELPPRPTRVRRRSRLFR